MKTWILAVIGLLLIIGFTVGPVAAQSTPATPPGLSAEDQARLNAYRQGSVPVGIGRRPRTPVRRRGTTETGLQNVPAFTESTGVNVAGEAPGLRLEDLAVSEAELPKDLIYSRIPKFPDNPALLREERDLKRIAREAFDQEIYWRNWEAVRLTLMTDGLNESIAYYVIALQYREDVTGPETSAEVDRLRKFMSRIAGQEVIILEKQRFVVVIASDMQGVEQFTNVKKLGELIEGRLNAEKKEGALDPAADSEGTSEVEAGGETPGR